MKKLISWIAYNNDFTYSKGQPSVKADGPNAALHKFHWRNYDEHLLLSTNPEGEDTKFEFLLNYLVRTFPKHVIQPVYLHIENQDLINLQVIQTRVNELLLSLREHELHICVSPGTPAMHTAWHLAHYDLGLQTTLIQLRPTAYSPKGIPERLEIGIDRSTITSGTIIRQDGQQQPRKTDYLITPSIEPVYQAAEKVAAASHVTALILGATGTGKEHLARYIHDQSIRAPKPFLPVNCSALQDSLLESRLFGYKKGAFTGAEKDTPGLFELANGGTIFLDEIGDISASLQQSLLRVLQEKEIQPIGGKAKKVDVRILAATHQDLHARCQSGQFRWDLYYRLTVADLELPSLLERGQEELKAYIKHFLRLKRKTFGRSRPLTLTKEVRQTLLSYPFPGNIRELENLIERLYVFCEDQVEIKDLPARLREVPETISLRWEDVEASHIRKVLSYFEGNKKRTCEALGYGSINTLTSKMGKYGIG